MVEQRRMFVCVYVESLDQSGRLRSHCLHGYLEKAYNFRYIMSMLHVGKMFDYKSLIIFAVLFR